jgi:hypothetical protein
MADIFQEDFRDFLKALNDEEVKYIVVGCMAVILNGHARLTGNMDILVDRTWANYKNLARPFINSK